VIFKTGSKVMIEYEGKKVEGVVRLASRNGRSLGLAFDAMLGGYAGLMPVLEVDGVYRDLMCNKEVKVMPVTG
jgi:hypothetical protein